MSLNPKNIPAHIHSVIDLFRLFQSQNDVSIVPRSNHERRPLFVDIVRENRCHTPSDKVDLSRFSPSNGFLQLSNSSMYVENEHFCATAPDIGEVQWEFKAEILLGLIIVFSMVIIILLFVVPCCRKRSSTTAVNRHRNSNIIRPDRRLIPTNTGESGSP